VGADCVVRLSLLVWPDREEQGDRRWRAPNGM
jgi:hypothetical protein